MPKEGLAVYSNMSEIEMQELTFTNKSSFCDLVGIVCVFSGNGSRELGGAGYRRDPGIQLDLIAELKEIKKILA
jgi:hypothetical protein